MGFIYFFHLLSGKWAAVRLFLFLRRLRCSSHRATYNKKSAVSTSSWRSPRCCKWPANELSWFLLMSSVLMPSRTYGRHWQCSTPSESSQPSNFSSELTSSGRAKVWSTYGQLGVFSLFFPQPLQPQPYATKTVEGPSAASSSRRVSRPDVSGGGAFRMCRGVRFEEEEEPERVKPKGWSRKTAANGEFGCFRLRGLLPRRGFLAGILRISGASLASPWR